MKNKIFMSIAVLICVVSTTYSETGIWLPASGGHWADTNNWQNGYVPQATTDLADFSALGSGETVMISNITYVGAMFFSGSSGDEWVIAATTNSASVVFGTTPLLSGFNGGEISVTDGTLTLMADIDAYQDRIVKSGSGVLRLIGVNNIDEETRLDNGTLILAEGAYMTRGYVAFNATNAVLSLEGNAAVGGIISFVEPAPGIDLNGYELRIGGSGRNANYSGVISGTGTLTVDGGEIQTFSSSQSYTGVTRLDNGVLQVGKAGKIVGWWRFDDAGDIGKDSGLLGNNLVPNGTSSQWQVNDAERGTVLNLDSGAYLKGQGAGLDIAGLPVGNQPFTIAFWLKPASDVPSTAILFSWGTYTTLNCNGMRLDTPSDSTPLLYTNWGNNRSIPASVNLADGNWHHIAVVYKGSYFMFYIDGDLVFYEYEVNTLDVKSGNFALGKGWSSNIYKGLLDDFLIADWAMSATELATVRENSQEPDGAQLDPGVAVEVGYGGSLLLSDDQTVTTLAGDGAAGSIELNEDSVLTVQGTASATSTVFCSAVSGNGKFVKNGVDYTLTLAGGNSYTGATEVQEGTLALIGEALPDPQAWYRFDDPSNLGKDSSGNGFDLGSINSPSYNSSGLSGGAAEFDVLDQDLLKYASGLPATFPAGNSSYTFAVWCNPDVDNTLGMPLYWGSSTSSAAGASLIRFNGQYSILLSNFNNNLSVNPGFNLFTNALNNGWHHIASTYNSITSNRIVYIDGVQLSSDILDTELNIQSQLFQLGGAPYSVNNFYDGLLDDVMIFDTVLSGDQIARLIGRTSVPQPIAHYSFDDETDLGQDSSGNALDLAPQGMVGYSSIGKRGGALNLSKNTQGYLSWTNGALPSLLTVGQRPITISAWVNPVSGADSDGAIVFCGTLTSHGVHMVGLYKDADRLGIYYTDSSTPNVEATPVAGLDIGDAPHGWHHVAAVYTGEGRVLYIDGVEVDQDDRDSINISGGSFYIGYKPNQSSKWFQGFMDEVEIFDTALNHNQILAVMRGGTDILPSDTSLNISSGAYLELNGQAQRVSALNGIGSLDLGGLLNSGLLTVSGAGGDFSGVISGYGDLMICGEAEQTLSGSSTFVGGVTVSNAILLIENIIGSATGSSNEVVVLNGGLIGGSGSVTGDLMIAEGGGFSVVPATTGLSVSGAVTLPEEGIVVLPDGFTTGSIPLLSASSISASSGFSNWSVQGMDNAFSSSFRVDGDTLTLKIYPAGMVILIN